MKKIQCFIACAFGKKDVDELYEGAIIKALEKLKIKGVRVDRVNHNEKIDKKILDLIAASQFGIADLTYARPSVYFESGLLEGQTKPVIYLARKDHFSSKLVDEFGNFKIHFDLITKNIIPWDTINNKLIEEIKSRIILVVKPLQQTLAEDVRTWKAKKVFGELSILEKVAKLRSLSLGYISRNFKSNWYIEKRHSEISVITEIDESKCWINILIGETFTKNHIQYYKPKGEIWGTRWKELGKNVPNVIVFFLSLRAIRTSTLDSSLYACKKIDSKYYKQVVEGKNYFYFVIDNIDLDTTLKPQLHKCIEILHKQHLTKFLKPTK